MVRRAGLIAIALLSVSIPGSGQEAEEGTFHLVTGSDSLWVRHFSAGESGAPSAVVLLVPGWPATGSDVLGLGQALSARGVHVVVFHPRGHAGSSGSAGFRHGVEDVAALWRWLDLPETSRELGTQGLPKILAGYSWGGGIALAYAAKESTVSRVVSIAGSDHGVFIRRFDEDPSYGDLFRRALLSTRAPDGPVHFDLEASLTELRDDMSEHDLVSIAGSIADRDILLLVGWDDDQVEVELQVIPFYRALRAEGAHSVRVVAFQDGHGFREVRQELQAALHAWILKRERQ